MKSCWITKHETIEQHELRNERKRIITARNPACFILHVVRSALIIKTMEISVKRNYGYYLVFKAENVNVEEDIEERIYPKLENGKNDFSKPPKRDINTDVIEQIVRVLDDLIDYREREFDSSSLIERLFEKLPDDSIQKLLSKLNRDYEVEQDVS
jgi:hypothetical protein